MFKAKEDQKEKKIAIKLKSVVIGQKTSYLLEKIIISIAFKKKWDKTFWTLIKNLKRSKKSQE